MSFQIIRADITQVQVDGIINAANSSLMGGGGVDGAIHRAAGPGLLEECKSLRGCPTGQAKATGAYKLPAKYIIHTVGPRWRDGKHDEEILLRSCYKESLKLAKELGLESIAFPLISSGIYGYPKQKAMEVATSEIRKFLELEDMMVYLVIFDRQSFEISEKVYKNVKKYIDEHYVTEHLKKDTRRSFKKEKSRADKDLFKKTTFQSFDDSYMVSESLNQARPAAAGQPKAERKLDDLLAGIEESFSTMLLRLIDEKGKTDADVYKKANVDRRLFSKIRNDRDYKPSKKTVLSFAIGLELNLDETRDLLMKAGFALSHSSKEDIVVEFCIKEGIYDIFEVNEILFKFDLKLLGV